MAAETTTTARVRERYAAKFEAMSPEQHITEAAGALADSRMADFRAAEKGSPEVQAALQAALVHGVLAIVKHLIRN